MRLRYTPEAVSDIRKIKHYIKFTLHSPAAAERIVKAILSACSSLKTFPNIGVSIAGRTALETDLRILLCEHWIVVYRIEPDSDTVSVSRVLDGRQDYLRILFGRTQLDLAADETGLEKER